MDIKTIHGSLTSQTQPNQKSLNSGTALFHSSKEETFSSPFLSRSLTERRRRVLHQNMNADARGRDCSGSTLLHSANDGDAWKLGRNDTTEDCQPNVNPSRKWNEWFGLLMQIHFDADNWRLYVTANNNLEREEGVKQC